ncbi:heavy metal-associated isoprenylated plant protein 41 [Heracleum sosnowskyi]|uniref:Heavy metal-associated isoprenylated plant protein 41 n=1 Tax=Heracleum sosnowskyi TaxID=360622 RepID=A0AAD8MH93_9APIA|nr:heavy metal-associated isoprenylated plant protein 41 [Heracleum sosnowskyi]
MADEKKANKKDKQIDNEQELEQVEDKWVKYYSSLHEILLVGEGDFSFSTCLAQSFGSASNIVASSLDSYDDVIKKYKNGKSNLSILDKLGASHLHEVDATKMKFHSNLSIRKFDQIIFNFPHAGFYGKEDNSLLIGMHKRLLDDFFQNACGMLYDQMVKYT